MKQNKPDGREAYITPSIEVIKMENEGVIATSGEPYHPITRSYSGSTSTVWFVLFHIHKLFKG